MKKVPVYLNESELCLIMLSLSLYIDKSSHPMPEMDKLLDRVKGEIDTFRGYVDLGKDWQ